MNRRSFLSLFGAGVAGLALEQAIPLGRVWSFPKEIVIAKFPHMPITVDDFFEKALPVGTMMHVRMPQHFTVRDYYREHDQLTEILKVGDVFTIRSVNLVNE